MKQENRNNYIAFIGDIRNSKNIEDRKSIQIKLNNVLNELNIVYNSTIMSNFIITLGDEFQGLLCSEKHLMEIILKIKKALYPVQLRFGIGIGAITTDINPEMSLGADGPGYYYARTAINEVKLSEHKKKTADYDIKIILNNNDSVLTISLNTIFMLMSCIENSWTDRQREVIWDLLEHKGNQNTAAKRMGITQPSLQKTLSNGHYYAYKTALENIDKILEEVYYDT